MLVNGKPSNIDRFGGLLLTLVVSVGGIVLSFPLGILLALARRAGSGRDEVVIPSYTCYTVAAAVVLDPDRYVARVCDSKTVTPLERERLYERITRAAVCWSVVGVDPGEIDRINIHQAGRRAMQRAGPSGPRRWRDLNPRWGCSPKPA